jgi:predicted nuclease of predicted toxin-antitoxin system
MRFLIDRCVGRLLSDWLRKQGHDVVESRELGPDPDDRGLLERAANEARILITIDTDFQGPETQLRNSTRVTQLVNKLRK